MTLDYAILERRLVQELALVGSATAGELRARLGVSQPTFSRLVARMNERILSAGRASSTRYAARRTAQDLPNRLPIYEITEEGRTVQLGLLHSVLPEGYYVESKSPALPSAFHRDLPYFLHELRPAGFLGRLLPRQHPELDLPSEVRLWPSNDVLRYVSRWGFNLPGSLIVGDEALQRHLERLATPLPEVAAGERARRYPRLAAQALEMGVPGSSAGGEQPKFLTSKANGVELLVKFPARGRDARSRRQADLLASEHLAHRVLAEHGVAASRSELLVAQDEVFLEVERFDRLPGGGRRGVMSLLALDAEYLGRMKSWTDSVARLADAKHVPRDTVEPTRLRELFGRLIGNTDMHPGNLAFIARGAQVLSLAPVYDMLPTLYAAPSAERANIELKLAAPSPADAAVWDRASRAAVEFWRAVARESLVSAGFRKIARSNLARVEAFRRSAERLPPA